jgi:superfamily II DNA or RNA helicase
MDLFKATFQSLDCFKLVVVDEVHHAAADS